MGDALFAMRTAMTFVDREMSLDYRNVGTRTQHGGTLTAAAFLLTPAARQRYFANDLRVANNTLFDQVEQRQLIQVVVDAVPTLVQERTVGQQQFAWVDVAFQLWQSQRTSQTARHVEGKQLDPAQRQPVIHHLVVVLLREPPGQQGPNAPMGGTGWLVTNYALDAQALPPVVLPA